MKQIKKYAFASIITGFLFLALTCPVPVSAAENNPCAEDIAMFCKGVQPADRAAIMACLEAHESELSDLCKHHEIKMEGLKGEMRESVRSRRQFVQICQADIEKFCKDVDLKERGYLSCINEHKNELSAPCADWLKGEQGEYMKAK